MYLQCQKGMQLKMEARRINKKLKTTIRLNEKAYNYIKLLSDKSKEKGKYMSMNKIIEKIIEEKMEE